ncbi:FMN reductase (plasmid) [Ensifer adhaerens]|uniref:FMN reductase n=1 Tax=Ensifer adhaerens TaxID=106592 RepID=UPI001CBF7EA2|nr:FMN reductase [Ensifer adhaerens]MBZ7927383.1 FMN reductase [Ensifer adhaerens]UAX97817.1 FMN reductase [Ensifer adhaerens]UAY05196.1 FMN reductase [Ensifer adhaerens]UAY12574.1 FMN reductase [Ensifer adhaerens]
MSALRLVSLTGSFNRPSKTRALADHIASLVEARYAVESELYDLNDVGPSLGRALWRKDLDRQASDVVNAVISADVLLVGSPTYKGSYPGLFKHLIDLIDPLELRGKPVILTATGGGDRHALVVEHQLRPLFGFFSARTLPTAIYAADVDFRDYQVAPSRLAARFEDLLSDLGDVLPKREKSVGYAA